MSYVMELNSAIIDAEHRIDNELMQLNSYKSELDNVKQRVDAAFGGSGVQYAQEMMDRISQTKQQVEDTIIRLEDAKDKLQRVSIVGRG